jgi:uncharacterized membrane protein YfcA
MLTTEELIVFLLMALVAEVIGTIGGFGSSLFFVPIAAYFFDFKTALGITGIFHVASNVSKIALFRQGVQKDLVIKIGIPAVLLVMLGAWLTQHLESDFLQLALHIVLISVSLFLLIFQQIKLQPNTANAVGGGIISGFLAGLTGTGGAIRGLTLAAFRLPKETFIATSAQIDFGVDFSRSIVYYNQGYVAGDVWMLIAPLLVISFVGSWIGKYILRLISENVFQKIVLVLILIIGLFGVISNLT